MRVVTISDVARVANVSMMTVSRVINNSDRVSEKTRRRVQEAIDQLGYHPNMMAKGLATGRSGLVAYVMSNLSDPFHAMVSKGIENACFEQGYTVIIYDAGSDHRVEECVDMLIERKIDGAIFHHLNMRPDQARRLLDNGVQCVMVDNEVVLDGVCGMNSDNYQGGRMAVEHLIARGHTRIGCITGSMGDARLDQMEYIDTFQRRIWFDRTRGCIDALHDHGLEPACLYEGSGTVRQGFLMAQHIAREIFTRPDRPTALYCENDILALGVVSEMLEQGVAVPSELAVVGHDGLEMSTILYPRVTTIMQPRYEMGYIAAEKLLMQIRGEGMGEAVIINATLFQGDTT